MARAALGMGVRELAAAAKVSVDTVARFERGEELRERTVDALQRALEAAGIKLIDENGDGPGVRLTKRISIILGVSVAKSRMVIHRSMPSWGWSVGTLAISGFRHWARIVLGLCC